MLFRSLDGKWRNPDELAFARGALGRNGRGDAGMKEELVRAIREGKPQGTLARFSYAARLCQWVQLGNAALLVGGEFSWDAARQSTDRSDANALLRKSYRPGWKPETD